MTENTQSSSSSYRLHEPRSIVHLLAASSRYTVAAVLLLSWPAAAQPPTAQTAVASQDPAPSRTTAFEERQLRPGRYLGAASCASANCHGSIDPLDATDVLQNEYLTWLDGDPHSQTYGALFDEESDLIARNLRLARPAYQEPVCLACHTLSVPRRLQEQPIDLEEGVSCEVCHGPASGWIAGHTEPEWTHKESIDRGLFDLRDPVRRSAVCLGCHLGDRERTVDHELIAAGHPELQFELDNYTAGIPPHWLDRTRRHGARAWALGQVSSFRRGLEQLARRAQSDRWPEFSDMSCDSCHHELTGDERRQVRGYRHRAGLPPWSPSRWAVLRHLVTHFAPDSSESLSNLVSELAETVAYMNRPQDTARIAESLAERLAGVERQIATVAIGRDAGRQLLLSIAGDYDYLRAADVASAEQAFLALNSLIAELARHDPTLARGPVAATLAEIDRLLAKRHQLDWEELERVLAKLSDELS